VSFPRGLKDRGGSVIDVDRDESRYGLAEVQDSTAQMIWLERFINRDQQGKVTYQVIDVLKLPPISKSQILVRSFCWVNGKRDREIIAIVEATDTEFRTTIHRAWRANIKTEKIEPMSPKGIACENIGWGV
jgi:hypothetical protein